MARKFSWKSYNVKETQVGVWSSRLALRAAEENFTLFRKDVGEEAEESAP